MPESFHTLSSFNKFTSLAKKALSDDSIFETGKIDSPLLLVGLMYREVGRVLEMEPGDEGKYPDHLSNSPLGEPQMSKLNKLINDVALPC